MKKTLQLFLTIGIFLSVNNLFSQDFIKTGSNTSNDTKINLVSSDNIKTVINVEVNGFYNEISNISGVQYNKIYLNDVVSLGETGQASLPTITKIIAIPNNKNVRVNIESSNSREIANYDVVPYQAPPMRNTNGIITNFVKDNSYYSKNTFMPSEVVSIKEIAVLRDVRIAVVTINPIQYNPAERTLKVYTELKFSLNYEGSSDYNNAPVTENHSKIFENIYKSLIFNYTSDNEITVAPKMLILTPDAFYNTVLPFAEWKNTKGIVTTIKKVSDLGLGASPTESQVKAWLSTYYASPDKPDYVLIIGDATGANAFPWFTVGFDKTDHPYSCLAGSDMMPDVSLGRISVQTTAELTTALNKLIAYEKTPDMTNTAWYKRAFVLHSNDGIDPINGQVAKNVFLNEGGFTNVDIVNPSASQSQITSYMNGGVSWIWLIGHGSPTAFEIPYWNMSNMPSLTFAKRLPQLIAIVCANADLDYSTSANCIGENWISSNEQNTASNVTAFTENCAFYTTDTLGRYMLYAYFRNNINDFGSMMNYGKMQAYTYFAGNSTVQETINQCINLGDPSQVTYSDVPKTLTVTTTQGTSANTNYTVNVKNGTANIENALVGINQGGVLKTSGYTDAAGNYTFDASAITPGPTVNITVTGKNLLTYQSSMLTTIVNSGEIPEKYELSQNYPNPFNPSTSIKFSIPQSSFVTLKVYDMLGKEVSSLVNGNLNAGVYSFNFDALKLSSGVYIYKLTAGDFSDIKKMNLIR